MLENRIDDLFACTEVFAVDRNSAERVLVTCDPLNANLPVLSNFAQKICAGSFLIPPSSFGDAAIPDLSIIDRIVYLPLFMIMTQRAVLDVLPCDFIDRQRAVL